MKLCFLSPGSQLRSCYAIDMIAADSCLFQRGIPPNHRFSNETKLCLPKISLQHPMVILGGFSGFDMIPWCLKGGGGHIWSPPGPPKKSLHLQTAPIFFSETPRFLTPQQFEATAAEPAWGGSCVASVERDFESKDRIVNKETSMSSGYTRNNISVEMFVQHVCPPETFTGNLTGPTLRKGTKEPTLL